MNTNIVYHKDTQPRDLGGGMTRRVLAYSPQLMTAEVSLEQGSTIAVHSHPHCQNTYILSGRFRFTVEGEDVEVSTGDTLALPPHTPHSTFCLEPGSLLDVFTPMREDFVG
ncbi:MAG: cupin domain-containing protein [Fretibacterium sp.]|nr:cupin domain-containing protein [Fretibacterium sp.]